MVKSKASQSGRRTRFERHASQVVFDPDSSSFVVTWAKCSRPMEERVAAHKDPLTWIPSVSAMATLYDRGCVPHTQTVYAARAVGRAVDAGDREMLDTEGAKKAAELVRDLSSMCVDATSPSVERDIRQAMRHLLDEIAAVRFLNSNARLFDESEVIPVLDKAAKECFGSDGFVSWPAQSMRRRFMFCLNRRERTEVAYTLVSLLFDVGSCPLLSLSDRRALRMQSIRHSGIDGDFSPESVHSFFTYALERMRVMKEEGRSGLGARMTQQQLADSLKACPVATEKLENQTKEQKCSS